MIVDLPTGLPPSERAELLASELAYSQDLQRSGEWIGLWRVAGQWASYSLFDVADHDRLHDILWGLPLFPFLTIEVTALARHRSWLGDDG